MSSAYEIKVVFVQKLGDDLRPESEGDAAIVLAPPTHFLIGIRPKEIAQET